MVYSPDGQHFTADPTKFSGTALTGYWYDPRSGTLIGIPDVQRSTACVQFQPPSSQDWVLVVDDAARGFGPPGQ